MKNKLLKLSIKIELKTLNIHFVKKIRYKKYTRNLMDFRKVIKLQIMPNKNIKSTKQSIHKQILFYLIHQIQLYHMKL